MTQNSAELEALKENIHALLDITVERDIKLAEVQGVHRKATNGSSGQNIDGIKNKIKKEPKLEKLKKIDSALEYLVYSHMLFDDKFVSIYTEVSEVDRLKDILDAYFDKELSKKFFGLTEKYAPYQKINISDVATIYQFGIVREVPIKEILDKSDIKQEIFEKYQEVYGVRKIPLSCYDSLIIDVENKRITTCVDLTRVLGTNTTNTAKNNLNVNLRKIINNKKLSSFLDESLNLFPCIQKLYSQPKDNRSLGVTLLSFLTPAGTSHEETLKSGNKDLRIATYHEKGVEGVKNEKKDKVPLNNDITPYRITMKYYRDVGDLEVTLKSNYRMAHTPNPSLSEASIYGTRSPEELEFILQKLLTLR